MDLEYMVICDQMDGGRTGYGLMMCNGEKRQSEAEWIWSTW